MENEIIGEIVDSMPVRGNVPEAASVWDAPAALARDNPGKIVLAGRRVALSRISALRMYKREPYKDVNGNRTIMISMRNSVVAQDGKRYGDVYFEWTGK